MSTGYATALGASRLLLRIFRVLNLGTGLLIIVAFVASFLLEPLFRDFFTRDPAASDPGLLMLVLRIWLVITLPLIGIVHILLSRLLAMVETVRAGDPFVPENAVRLNHIAWSMLAIQLYDLSFGVMAAMMNAAGSNIDWSFKATGWLAVALLFVLARVFEHGTRMRSDLEAMI